MAHMTVTPIKTGNFALLAALNALMRIRFPVLAVYSINSMNKIVEPNAINSRSSENNPKICLPNILERLPIMIGYDHSEF